jgi:small ligand-binding sensory domain FIST
MEILRMEHTFRAGQGSGADWNVACAQCLEQLSGLPPGANLGFVYASDPLADALDLIVARLREATGVSDWVGTGGAAVCASGQEHFRGGAIVTLVAALPANGFRLFDRVHDGAGELDPATAAWMRRDLVGCGVVHGDPRQVDVAASLARLSGASSAFLVGGLSSANGSAMQIAGRPTEGGLSGVLFGADVQVVTGLSQGCAPVGQAHEVTASQGPWILSLDGRPAVDVLKEEIGEVLARNLERIAGFIHVALPIVGADRPDYVVRNLLAVDLRRGIIAIGDQLRVGTPLMFVKRDPTTAQADLSRVLEDLRNRSAGRPIRGALYHSCVARGPHMFGPDSAELKTIERALGPVPLAGFFTNGEIFRDRLYSYSGVLTLFLG